MNLIERLKELEVRIYAADGDEACKHVDQFQYALYEAWPKLLAVVEAVDLIEWDTKDPIEKIIADALAALEDK